MVAIANITIVSDQVSYGVLCVGGQRADASDHSQLFSVMLRPHYCLGFEFLLRISGTHGVGNRDCRAQK